jgi:hypothetical protein
MFIVKQHCLFWNSVLNNSCTTHAVNTDYLAIKHGVLFIINSDYPLCMCMCVKEREREREREKGIEFLLKIIWMLRLKLIPYRMVYVLLLQSFICQVTHYCKMYGVTFYTNCTLFFVLFVLLISYSLSLSHYFICPFPPPDFFFLFLATTGRTISTSSSHIKTRFFYSKYIIYPQWELFYFHFPKTALLSITVFRIWYGHSNTNVCVTNRTNVCLLTDWLNVT